MNIAQGSISLPVSNETVALYVKLAAEDSWFQRNSGE